MAIEERLACDQQVLLGPDGCSEVIDETDRKAVEADDEENIVETFATY